MEALRYPEDFDGIISGSPAMDITDLNAIYGSWVRKANLADGSPIIKENDIALIQDAVYEACDALDGLEDGLIDDPRMCNFDPETLRCSGEEGDCLTARQIETLKMWYSKPQDSKGNVLYPDRIPLGSEPYWYLWLTGRTTESGQSRGLVDRFNEEGLRYLDFEEDPGGQYSILDFDLDTAHRRTEYMSTILNSDNPDIRDFRDAGGKLLMWHGWADLATPPLRSIQYYEAVEDWAGGTESTQIFLRLFMLPGAVHCGEPDGPGMHGNGFDTLAAMEKWVEEGQAPESIQMTKLNEENGVLWTRPACPYPQRAEYKGEGDVKAVSSFECVDP